MVETYNHITICFPPTCSVMQLINAGSSVPYATNNLHRRTRAIYKSCHMNPLFRGAPREVIKG